MLYVLWTVENACFIVLFLFLFSGSGSTGDTFSEVNELERPEKQLKRSNTWSQEDGPKPPKHRKYSEPDNPQTNQQTEHNTNNEQDLQDLQKTETEAMSSQTLPDKSAGIQSTDVDGDSLPQQFSHNPDRVLEQKNCSQVNVVLEDEDGETQSNRNNKTTRGACFTECLTCILSVILILMFFLFLIIIIIIGVIIYNCLK